MKHDLTLVVLMPEQIARAREANGRRKRITHGLVCGPYGQMFGTERQCLKYFTAWDPDHRIEVAPEQFQALFADLFDKAVKTTAYAISDNARAGRLLWSGIAGASPGFGRTGRRPTARGRRKCRRRCWFNRSWKTLLWRRLTDAWH